METLKPGGSGARPNHKHHRGGGEPSSSTPMLALINRDGGDEEDGAGAVGGSASGRSDRGRLPAKRRSFMLFERASAKWWNPQFESKVLERQFWKNSFPHLRTRFRWGLAFIVLSYSMWTLYSLFALHWRFFGAFHIPAFSLIFAFSFLLIFTYFRPYERFYLAASACAGILLFFSTVLCFIMTGAPAVLSVVAMLAVSLELVLITYTIIPLPLYVCVLGGLSYSAIVEVVLWQQRQAYRYV